MSMREMDSLYIRLMICLNGELNCGNYYKIEKSYHLIIICFRNISFTQKPYQQTQTTDHKQLKKISKMHSTMKKKDRIGKKPILSSI